jgi:hypothetical protein
LKIAPNLLTLSKIGFMKKELLLKSILIELNKLPEVYLQQWYELIHTFRERLPVDESDEVTSKETDFDWDAIVNEVMTNRRQSNLQRMSRLETLLNDQ